jgi:predicted O-linked N-acetylglucosamine transferase (SPINDLY family)
MRVGFVSPDLRNHPVGRFLDPLLSDVDRNELTLLGFGQIARADGMTHRLADGFDFYTNLYGLDDDAAADTIAAQQVDLLIDLAGHTAGNRLGVLARRPAPVQATWLGYPDTTGMAAVGYRLVDALTDPPDQPSWCSERLIRMDGPMHCYVGPESPPDVGDLPARHNGVITFGSFNNNRKLSHPTLDLWARLLGAVPQSRLVLKFRPGGDEQVAGHYRDAFAVRGIDPERVEVLAPLPEQDYLRAYQQIDIALDPVGYHGTTTTCEALWMGVPVVSLQGHRHASRVGGSLLNAVGLSHLAVSSPETFIRRAAAMAGDKASLSGLRRSLRERMQHSPLCDRAGFARRFEHACRSIRADAAGRG